MVNNQKGKVFNKQQKQYILNKVAELCAPAHGCTEIGAIGLAVAAASKACKTNILKVKRISVEVSPYIFRNVMRVGVPNLGACGISKIIAVAAAIADPSRKLKMFSSVTPKQLDIGNKLLEKIVVHINDDRDPVYVKVNIYSDKNVVESLIEKDHSNLIYVKYDGHKEIYKKEPISKKDINLHEKYGVESFRVVDLIRIVKYFSVDDLSFLLDKFKLNQNISSYGKENLIKGSYANIYKKLMDKKPTLNQQILYDLAAAIDARMSGAVMPVMSSCGSGDHGLTASIPQYTYHIYTKNSDLTFLRGLMLTNLFVWKIKSSIGNLSCMCGSVVAATTATVCGLAYQMGMNEQQICYLMEQMLCSFNSAICDGAKMSCTHKVCTALISGLHMIDMAKANYKIKEHDGIIAGNPDVTLKIYKKMSDENSKVYSKSVVNAIIDFN